eukprot:1149859-Amphidinium_carterae.1
MFSARLRKDTSLPQHGNLELARGLESQLGLTNPLKGAMAEMPAIVPSLQQNARSSPTLVEDEWNYKYFLACCFLVQS